MQLMLPNNSTFRDEAEIMQKRPSIRGVSDLGLLRYPQKCPEY
jgi:hypothetical protein